MYTHKQDTDYSISIYLSFSQNLDRNLYGRLTTTITPLSNAVQRRHGNQAGVRSLPLTLTWAFMGVIFVDLTLNELRAENFP